MNYVSERMKNVNSMKPSIFLSHSSKDKEFVRRLAKDLHQAGAQVWIDDGEIKLGDSLIEKISEGVDEMDYLAVVLSKNSVESEWVKREINIALTGEVINKKVKVLPLVLDDCKIPAFLRDKLRADFSRPEKYQVSFEMIVDKLGLQTEDMDENLQPYELLSHAAFDLLNTEGKTSGEIFEMIAEKTEYLLGLVDGFILGLKNREDTYNWIEEFEEQIQSIKTKWEERRFKVAVMALMKSGKSTLLNSWIGNEYLPSGAVAETMRIIRIRHTKRKHIGVLLSEQNEVARGADDIRRFIRELNSQARDLEKGEREEELLLNVSLAVLNKRKMSGYGFDILDTPGTNESGIATLQAKVERIAKQCDVIVYLMDFTKLKTKDEEQMLENLKKWRSEIFDQLKNRMFFVVNKMDTANRHDREKKMTPTEVRKYVKTIIHDSISVSIAEEDVILISAERALLGRLLESGNASAEQKSDFMQIAFGEYGAEDATDEEALNAIPKILDKSGFKELEDKVLDVIYKKRSQIFFSSIVDDTLRYIEQVSNNLEVGKAALNNNKEQVEKLQKEILKIQGELKSFSLATDQFKKKVKNTIHSSFSEFKKTVSYEVRSAFTSPDGSRPAYRWIEEKSSFWGGSDYVIKDPNPNLVQEKFSRLHEHILTRIENRFDLMWNDIFELLYQQFESHRVELETKSIPIVRKVESVINEGLNIELKPVPVQFKRPTFDRFYDQSIAQLNSLMNIKTESNMNFLQSVWHSILRLFNLGRDEVHTNVTEVSFKQYTSYMNDNIESYIQEPQNLAIEIVNRMYLSTTKSATQELDGLVARYVSIISDEIKAKGGSETDVSERVKLFEKDLEETRTILSNTKKLQNYIK